MGVNKGVNYRLNKDLKIAFLFPTFTISYQQKQMSTEML